MKISFEAGRGWPANMALLGQAAIHQVRLAFDSQYFTDAMIDEAEAGQNHWDNFFDKFPLVIEDRVADHQHQLSFRARALGHHVCDSLSNGSLDSYGQLLALRQVVESLPPEAVDNVLRLSALSPLRPYFGGQAGSAEFPD